MRTLWIVALVVPLAGCIDSMRDLEIVSVDKTPVDTPVFEQTPTVMFETCAKVLEEEDYKVTKADRKTGELIGQQVLASSLDQEGTRSTATLKLEKKGTGSIVHVCIVREINKNIEDPSDEKKAKWKTNDRDSDAEQKIVFKLRHRLGDDAKEAMEDFKKRHEKESPMAKQMAQPLDTDHWQESCTFHTSIERVWAASEGALAGWKLLGANAKSRRIETEWDVQPGVDGHWTRKKVFLQVEPTDFDFMVKVMAKWEISADGVKDPKAAGAKWDPIGNDEETERKVLLQVTSELKG